MKNLKTLLTTASILAFASGASAAELNIYAWSGELPQEIVDDFAKETGITVTFDTYDSNETMMAKLSAGATGYDLIEPSQYTVQVLAKQGLLLELDHAKIPNIDNLGVPFKNVSFDPGQKWSVPYIWGTTGFAYNEDCVKTPPTSWKALWDPQYEGRIYMLDNMLAAYIAGLQVNGFHAGTTNPEEIEKAIVERGAKAVAVERHVRPGDGDQSEDKICHAGRRRLDVDRWFRHSDIGEECRGSLQVHGLRHAPGRRCEGGGPLEIGDRDRQGQGVATEERGGKRRDLSAGRQADEGRLHPRRR